MVVLDCTEVIESLVLDELFACARLELVGDADDRRVNTRLTNLLDKRRIDSRIIADIRQHHHSVLGVLFDQRFDVLLQTAFTFVKSTLEGGTTACMDGVDDSKQSVFIDCVLSLARYDSACVVVKCDQSEAVVRA